MRWQKPAGGGRRVLSSFAPLQRTALGLLLGLAALELTALGTETARQGWAHYRAEAPYRALGAEGPGRAIEGPGLRAGERAAWFCAPKPFLILTLEGQGWGGPFRLALRFDGPSAAGALRVLQHHETPRYGGKILGPPPPTAGTPLPAPVDGLSGATFTAEALGALRDRGAVLATRLWPLAPAPCEATP